METSGENFHVVKCIGAYCGNTNTKNINQELFVLCYCFARKKPIKCKVKKKLKQYMY